jgi:RecJ-like exonuclease
VKREKYVARHRFEIASRSLIDLKPVARDLFDDMIEYFKDIGGIRRKNFLNLITTSRYREYDKTFDLDIPLESTCHNCKGIGAIASYTCDECNGTGVLKKTNSIRLEVPASAPDGTLLTKELTDHKIVIRVTYG